MKLRNLLVNAGDYPYYGMIALELREMRTVLDVGCGSNSPLSKIKKHFYCVGVDIHKPSIAASRQQKIHDEHVVGNVFDIDKLLRGKRFDAVVALDLIEHLPKEKGWKLLRKMTKLAKKKVLLLTPNGFIKQTPVDGNEFQKHLSGWSVDDFKQMGYQIYGIRGLKWLRGEYATIKWKPWFFWSAVSTISELFVFFVPRLANQLFVVKHL